MNRMEFMAELERLLAGMPAEERQAAVQYYADYFADAGVENESEVIKELVSPEKVAASIKADYYGTEFNEEKFDQKAYMEKYGRRSSDTEDRGTQKKQPWSSNGLKVLLIILIAIVVWPVTLAIVCVVFALAIAAVSVFASLVIASAAVLAAGIITVIVGFALIFAIPPAALITIGIGLLLSVFGLIATVGTVKLCIIVYPAMLRGFVNLCRRPLYGKAV
ncbi:MAG TPA: DUF1700 domain-containing protein [Candidatus Mediterraneibacter pullistercoris]|nr:DUF1700 domain-containing protein [Candidatus Mediterraneibacter pullistercoris]